MTLKEIEALKNVDVRTVDRKELVDIREVEVDHCLPVEKKSGNLLRK